MSGIRMNHGIATWELYIKALCFTPTKYLFKLSVSLCEHSMCLEVVSRGPWAEKVEKRRCEAYA